MVHYESNKRLLVLPALYRMDGIRQVLQIVLFLG
jgi:hypothetical protein